MWFAEGDNIEIRGAGLGSSPEKVLLLRLVDASIVLFHHKALKVYDPKRAATGCNTYFFAPHVSVWRRTIIDLKSSRLRSLRTSK